MLYQEERKRDCKIDIKHTRGKFCIAKLFLVNIDEFKYGYSLFIVNTGTTMKVQEEETSIKSV